MKLAAVDGIVGQVEAGSFIGEKMSKLFQYSPMAFSHPVSGLAAIDGGEFKWSTYVGIGIGQSDPLAEWSQALCLGIIL